jgi:hypothetical protein
MGWAAAPQSVSLYPVRSGAGWHAHVFVGMPSDPGHAHEDVTRRHVPPSRWPGGTSPRGRAGARPGRSDRHHPIQARRPDGRGSGALDGLTVRWSRDAVRGVIVELGASRREMTTPSRHHRHPFLPGEIEARLTPSPAPPTAHGQADQSPSASISHVDLPPLLPTDPRSELKDLVVPAVAVSALST